ISYALNEQKATDQYARLYDENVVATIDHLNLPRYGLGNYVRPTLTDLTTDQEQTLANLGRAGQRLMGFCRTNLFKRLESSGASFLRSLERHCVRNFVYQYALQQGLELPIGTQDIGMLDSRSLDIDTDAY